MPASSLGLLDNIRYSNGIQGLINYYRELLRCDLQKALDLINDPGLRFCTLYVLKSEVSGSETRGKLEPSYSTALELAGKLSGEVSPRFEKEVRAAGGNTAALLEWMFRTGLEEIEPDSEYELIMERIACLLVKSCNNRSILPELAELIFFRHRRGALIHELAWAFFEARCVESLPLIAYRLDSPDIRDVRLAIKLLGFIPADSMTYDKAMSWISGNRPFLYYTGESLHLDGRPQHYRVSLAAKYMCLPVSPDTGEPAVPLRDTGQELLVSFSKLSDSLQQKLADFSWYLYRQDNYEWNRWIRLSFKEQAERLNQMTGWLS
ncbi:MAG TPA: hypothetical protein VHT96_17890 [Clostridia bacterium]|nr:hypothetical protein [Clostridia bacterium]